MKGEESGLVGVYASLVHDVLFWRLIWEGLPQEVQEVALALWGYLGEHILLVVSVVLLVSRLRGWFKGYLKAEVRGVLKEELEALNRRDHPPR